MRRVVDSIPHLDGTNLMRLFPTGEPDLAPYLPICVPDSLVPGWRIGHSVRVGCLVDRRHWGGRLWMIARSADSVEVWILVGSVFGWDGRSSLPRPSRMRSAMGSG